MTTEELMVEVDRLRGVLARIESLVWYEPQDDDDTVESVRAMVRERDEARAEAQAWQAEELARRTERDAARAESDELRRERDQLLARLRAVYPWVGVTPFVPAAIAHLSLERDLARDSIEEISADIRRRGW